jgi:hypothetical protein
VWSPPRFEQKRAKYYGRALHTIQRRPGDIPTQPHIEQIYSKLGVENRTAAAAIAVNATHRKS